MHSPDLTASNKFDRSLISTFSLLVFLAHRFATLRKWNKHAPPVNQCGMLVANLLLADFLQALSLALSFHWLMADAILAPDRYCWAQAALLHLGDLASGFLVLLIAIHAACSVLMGRRMGFRWLVASVGAVWIAAVIITISGPLKFGKPFFTRAGSWVSTSRKSSVGSSAKNVSAPFHQPKTRNV